MAKDMKYDDGSLLMTAKQVAIDLVISVREIWRLRNARLMPAPVLIGRSVRWRRSDILKWIEMGCPPLDS